MTDKIERFESVKNGASDSTLNFFKNGLDKWEYLRHTLRYDRNQPQIKRQKTMRFIRDIPKRLIL